MWKFNSFVADSPSKSKHNGVFLNDELLVGPDLLTNLSGVLLRFREELVAVAADTEAIFHQCRIIEEDQPALRYLWRNLELHRAPYLRNSVIPPARRIICSGKPLTTTVMVHCFPLVQLKP